MPLSESAHSPGMCLANNMKMLRSSQALSQEQLSERSGVPRSTIASLERGEGNPTLQVLMGLAKGLGVTIAEILEPPHPKAVLYKAEHHVRIPKNLAGLARQTKGTSVDIVRLTPAHSRYLVMEEVVLKSGERFAGSPHPPGTEEYFVALSGSFELEIAEEKFIIQENDVLCFDGNQKHTYACAKETKLARGMSVVVQVPRI